MAMCMWAAAGTLSCDSPAEKIVKDGDQKIIGGFAANAPVLDAIGSLVLHFDGGAFPFPSQELCGATLIAPASVLTAKHCAEVVPLILSIGGRLTFAIGPDSTNPAREVDVVDIEVAPGDVGGFVGVGHDVSVMHLGTAITDIPPVDLAVLVDQQVGQPFSAIGYGVQDNSGTFGTRRLGKQTLRSRHGRIFETLFGNFANFFDWFLDGTAPPSSPGGSGGGGGLAGAGGAGGEGGAGVGGAGGGTGGAGGGLGGSGGGAGSSGRGGAGGRTGAGGGSPFPPPISLEDFAHQLYDSTVLDDGYEVVTGGAPGDAQPCFGDSGSSLIKRLGGKFVSYGVVSGGLGTRDSICDLGTVYATFGPEVLAFLQTAKQWIDPCGDIDSTGTCDGSTALRCTNLNEGRRRLVSFDCASLEMACGSTGGQVSCDGNTFAPPPSPPPTTPPRDPRAMVDRVFMTPASLAAKVSSPSSP
jgi:hypothetical protein